MLHIAVFPIRYGVKVVEVMSVLVYMMLCLIPPLRTRQTMAISAETLQGRKGFYVLGR